jgi:hypothetical protein
MFIFSVSDSSNVRDRESYSSKNNNFVNQYNNYEQSLRDICNKSTNSKNNSEIFTFNQ